MFLADIIKGAVDVGALGCELILGLGVSGNIALFAKIVCPLKTDTGIEIVGKGGVVIPLTVHKVAVEAVGGSGVQDFLQGERAIAQGVFIGKGRKGIRMTIIFLIIDIATHRDIVQRV